MEMEKSQIIMLYSIIIPCYNSSKTIRKAVELTMAEMDRLGRVPYEFILVEDSSPDHGATASELQALAEQYPCVTAVLLASNAGQHNATMAGLNHASGDILISMDDDLQTHPSQLPILFAELDKGYDIVYGYYPEKKHSAFRNFGSSVNSMSVRLLIGKPKSMRTSSFWMIRRFVRDHVIEYKSKYTYLQGLFLRTTRNISCVPVKHFEREVGTSNYTFKKLLKLWSNIMGYSVVPLRLASWVGVGFSILAIIAAIFIVIRKLLVPTMALGWPSMMVTICFFAGMNLMFLGLIGEYIGRMFLGMNKDPQYVVRQVCHQEDPSEKKTEV